MRVITAPEKVVLNDGEISVFLAGGITDCYNWQQDIINYIESKNFAEKENLVLLNPRRENFPIHDPSASMEQITWEFNALENADIFSMYFVNNKSVQPICMYELGRNIVKMQMRKPIDWKDRIIISVEDGYKREQDVQIQVELACGKYIPVNTGFGAERTMWYHGDYIVRSYHNILRRWKDFYGYKIYKKYI